MKTFRAGVPSDFAVTIESFKVHLISARLDSRPLDAEQNPVDAEVCRDVEHQFIVSPEFIRVARSCVTTQGNGRGETSGGLMRPVESAFDGVALEGGEHERTVGHLVSFARPRVGKTCKFPSVPEGLSQGEIMADELLRERRGHVEILTINRPDQRNAINRTTALAMDEALNECEVDDDVWVVVLTGADTKAFSAGMDLKAFVTGEFPITPNGFGGLTKRNFSKPIIAAANGTALAGGFELMISCDMVVAADHAKFGITEAQRGLIAGGGGLIRLAKLVPRAVAYEMALTAEPIDAQRAYELGLVNRVVPGDQVLDAAVALAERISKNAPLAVRVSKRLMHDSIEMSEDEAWTANDEAFGLIGRSEDAREGAMAFAERREPKWQGK